MKAEIIAVGTEIMLGDINNSHARYISQNLAQLGIDVCYHTAVGDNEKRLIETFYNALKRNDIVITTGGLGPTADDLTKEAVCKVLGLKLTKDYEVLEKIKAYFARSGRQMPTCNEKQAEIPNGAIVLDNEHGTAPGLIIQAHDKTKTIILLPGPPSELIPMFDNEVFEYLKKLSNTVIVSRNLKVIGVGESRVEDLTSELLKGENPSAALYAGTGEVRIRLTAKANTILEAEEMILPLEQKFKTKLGDTVYTDEDETIEQTVVRLLKEKGLKITTAESCSGGLVAKMLTGVSGVSEVFECGVVSYSNDVKHKELKVSPKTLYLYGAVSEHTSIEMAVGAKKKAGADIAVAITGFAGPDGGTEYNPVGTVYITVAFENKVWTNHITAGHGITVERELIRELAAKTALDMVRHIILETPKSTLYLTSVKDAFDACSDVVIKEGEYVPEWIKIAKMIIPWKNDSLMEIARKLIIIVAAIVFVITGVLISSYMSERIESDNTVKETQQLYTIEPTAEQLYSLPYGYLDKFAGLYNENKRVRGWITIPDSKVDFPVVQSADNEYYLNHDFYGNYNSNGVPFVDYRTNIGEGNELDDNTIIYAHNIKGGRYFAELCEYKELDFYKKRPVITFDSVYEEMDWKIVGCFIANAEPEQDDGEVFMYNNYINFDSEEQFDWFMEEINRRTIIDTGVDVKYGDSLLTLSTCTYEFDDARFVLIARKVRVGESKEVDTEGAVYNDNTLYPQAWYDKNGGEKPNLPDNPEPVNTEEKVIETGSAVPFYEFLSSYEEPVFSSKKTTSKASKSDKTSSFTSSSYTDRIYYVSSKLGKEYTSSYGLAVGKDKSDSKSKDKGTSSKKSTSSKKK